LPYRSAEEKTRRLSLLDDAVSIFIVSPSFELLRQRLLSRGTDSQADLERRLRGAPAEVEQHRDFQYVILNDDINRASQQLMRGRAPR
jgi:guanylate kinase